MQRFPDAPDLPEAFTVLRPPGRPRTYWHTLIDNGLQRKLALFCTGPAYEWALVAALDKCVLRTKPTRPTGPNLFRLVHSSLEAVIYLRKAGIAAF